MPVMQSSFLLPLSPAIPFLVEDVYVKGGFQCVATTAIRDAIKAGARKVGMLVYCADTDTIYALGADKTTWTEFSPDFDLDGALTTDGSIVKANVQGKLQIGLSTTNKLPVPPGAGYIMVSTATGWMCVEMAALAGKGQRVLQEFEAPDYVEVGAHVDFVLDARPTAMLLQTQLNAPDIKLQFFESVDRVDSNPYTFISTEDRMTDDGIQEIDGKLVAYRRYSFVSNRAGLAKVYGRFTNIGSGPARPKLVLTYLALE